jgi:hypothetical protein
MRVHAGRLGNDACLFGRHGVRAALLSNNDADHVGEPDNTSHDAICNLARGSVVGKHETEATIDHAQGDDSPTKPKMGVRCEGSLALLLEALVVEETENGLEKDENEQDNSDDGMIFIQLCRSDMDPAYAGE